MEPLEAMYEKAVLEKAALRQQVNTLLQIVGYLAADDIYEGNPVDIDPANLGEWKVEVRNEDGLIVVEVSV